MTNRRVYATALSFIIIGRNAEWSIARLLDSVIAGAPVNLTYEIIYVDSASIDRTVDIVRRYAVNIVQLSPDQPLCASAARFIGAQHATGEYIFFIDSDMEIVSGWAQRALTILTRHPDIAVLAGPQINADIRNASEQLIDYSSYSGSNLRDIKFAGSAAIFRHSVLDAAGTWNPYIISDEEPELCLRIRHAGYRVAELDYPVAFHFGLSTMTISTLLSRRRRRLFLGYGQIIRYHFGGPLLFAYLHERGFVFVPALTAFLAIGAVLISCMSQSFSYAFDFVGVLLLVFAIDALRSRSMYTALFHVAHRILILEGTIRGLLLQPRDPSGYPGQVAPSARFSDLSPDDSLGSGLSA